MSKLPSSKWTSLYTFGCYVNQTQNFPFSVCAFPDETGFVGDGIWFNYGSSSLEDFGRADLDKMMQDAYR